MQKIILSLLCVLLLVSEASALPAFTRQTGMACLACHQQHFPILSNFGRAFKAAGYATVGTQGKIESERLSIPANMNAAILVKLRYQKDNTAGVGNQTTGVPNGLGDGQLQFGDEFSLYLGGRVAENIGFLFEGNTLAAGSSLLSSFKLPISFDIDATKLSVIPFTTDILGAQYGYELSSGGVLRANRWAEHRRETSAIQYNADQGVDGGAATGFALVVQNDLGYINLTKWAPAFAMGGNAGSGTRNSYDMNSRYMRIAATPTVGEWALVTGVGMMSGSSLTNNPATPVPPIVLPAVLIDTRQTFVDLQAHGKINEHDLGIYVQHASAPATASGNAYNRGTSTRKAYTIGADYSVTPNILNIGAAYRYAQNGAATANGDNAITLTTAYNLAQNVALHFNHSQYSGSARNVTGAATRLTTLMLEASW